MDPEVPTAQTSVLPLPQTALRFVTAVVVGCDQLVPSQWLLVSAAPTIHASFGAMAQMELGEIACATVDHALPSQWIVTNGPTAHTSFEPLPATTASAIPAVPAGAL